MPLWLAYAAMTFAEFCTRSPISLSLLPSELDSTAALSRSDRMATSLPPSALFTESRNALASFGLMA